ncbi:MAG: serine hydrolase, partial [Chloroflexus sp.]|nr:serine hydrolase [Chloroflexus sp.]
MNFRPRLFAIALICMAILAGCTSASRSQLPYEPVLAAEATPVPVTPSPTPLPVYAPGTEVANVPIGGLTATEAEAVLAAALTANVVPLKLVAGGYTYTIDPATLQLRPDLTTLLAEAAPALGSNTPVNVPLQLIFNEDTLHEQMRAFAAETALPPQVTVISSTEVLSRSFAYLPGRAIDLDRSVEIVSGLLRRGRITTPIALTLWPTNDQPRISTAQLAEQLEQMAEVWDGVAGIYLYDLATGTEVAVNARTVFPGASTIKTAIMLYGYTKLETFTEEQRQRMRLMIVESDNLAANDILAAGAGGVGTDIAFRGAVEMSDMLADLGLEHTYLYIPFESVDYIKLYNIKYRCGPKDPVGEPPYTETGCALRATPY